jgi:hypothetical protein
MENSHSLSTAMTKWTSVVDLDPQGSAFGSEQCCGSRAFCYGYDPAFHFDTDPDP